MVLTNVEKRQLLVAEVAWSLALPEKFFDGRALRQVEGLILTFGTFLWCFARLALLLKFKF